MMQKNEFRARNVAIVGPYSSGKTTLLESLLSVTGTVPRKGRISEGNTVGDAAPEARDRQMSVEVNVASAEYEGVRFNFLDCPGSVEFAQETYNALMGIDAAVVVCEPSCDRVLTLAPLLKFLDDWEIPHLVFVNKMDRGPGQGEFMEVLHALKRISSRPLVPHQYPIGQGKQLLGFIDLVTEEAYHYHAAAPADPVPFPQTLQAEEQAARNEMLEVLADFDDRLLEELIEDIQPSQAEISRDLKMDLGADLIVPVFLGVATEDYGVRPLLNALLQETPEPAATAARRQAHLKTDEPLAQVLKTYYTPKGGRLSLVRVWHGVLQEGDILNGVRVGSFIHLVGPQQQSLPTAQAGDIVAISRVEGIQTGDTLSPNPTPPLVLPKVERLTPVYALAIAPENRKDEVKLNSALSKLTDEDPALYWEQQGDTHEVILWGQGDIHLQVALDRLRRKYNLPVGTRTPQVPYCETIRHGVRDVHGRYKHQSGGHGQYGDVYLDIQPLPRGGGFQFSETIVGGAVPRQYIPGVEGGVREYLEHGPLGFPIVDVAVTLKNGSYHSVDSSELAFKHAARIAMQTGIAKGEPILLEPILTIAVSVPSDFTAVVMRLASGRRGQILGYEAKAEWTGWDRVTAYFPQVEMQDLILELRSLTMGVGFFDWKYDRYQEMPEKLAQQVVAIVSTNNGKA